MPYVSQVINLMLIQRAQTEAVTFLGNHDSSRSLYAIPGLDYVAHEDILPYTTKEKVPLQHELFDKFLIQQPDKGKNIQLWQSLHLTSVLYHQYFIAGCKARE